MTQQQGGNIQPVTLSRCGCIIPAVQIRHTSLELLQADITTLDVDAIVNAANESLLGGGGVDGAIHRAAGPDLLKECRALGGCPTGEAKITKGYRLKARHVIHTVGPIYNLAKVLEPSQGSPAELLASAVRNSLRLADTHGLKSIAFPAISTGAYGYPLTEAARVILAAIVDHLRRGETALERVIVCLYDQWAYRAFETVLRDQMEATTG
jgi:O-acetyl-ADP-ribose deacetylase (regulator of RNase III)